MIGLVVIVMSIVLMIGVGISTIHLRSLRAVETTEESIRALYAADSGLEATLLYVYGDAGSPTPQDKTEMHNNAFYYTESKDSDHDECDAEFYCVDSFGQYEDIRRALGVEY